jgi:hypothetical protein
MTKFIHFAALLIAAALAGTSMASGQSLTNEECRELGKALSKFPPVMGAVEEGLPKFENALKDKLLPRTSDQLRATTVSAIQASQELLPVLRNFNARVEAIGNQLQLCADASPAMKSPDASTPPTNPVAPKDDLKSGTASVSPPPGASAPVAKVEPPTVRSDTANLASRFQDAEAARNRGDYTTAIQTYRSLADQGHAAAQLALGLMYVKAQGVPQDLTVAQIWFKRAVTNPAADQATRDDANYNSEFIAKRLATAQEAAKEPSHIQPRQLSPYDSWESRQLCEAAIKNTATHPSTVDIWGFTGYGTVVRPNNDRAIKQTFTAKNEFGLELKFDAYCTITPDGKLSSFSVDERR